MVLLCLDSGMRRADETQCEFKNLDTDITRNYFHIFWEACQSRALLTMVARTEDDVGRGVLSF